MQQREQQKNRLNNDPRWREMLRRSFPPWDWFQRDHEDRQLERRVSDANQRRDVSADEGSGQQGSYSDRGSRAGILRGSAVSDGGESRGTTSYPACCHPTADRVSEVRAVRVASVLRNRRCA